MASKKIGAKLVKLERAPFKTDSHPSETDLDKMSNSNYDLIVPPDVTIREQNQIILDEMYKWGWFENHLGLETKNEKTRVSESGEQSSPVTVAAVE